eukprot:2477541-Pyramimonas_sp.AAC.1
MRDPCSTRPPGVARCATCVAPARLASPGVRHMPHPPACRRQVCDTCRTRPPDICQVCPTLRRVNIHTHSPRLRVAAEPEAQAEENTSPHNPLAPSYTLLHPTTPYYMLQNSTQGQDRLILPELCLFPGSVRPPGVRRVCESCLTCPDGEYLFSRCRIAENAKCLPCLTCSSDEVELEPCTRVSNTVCGRPFVVTQYEDLDLSEEDPEQNCRQQIDPFIAVRGPCSNIKYQGWPIRWVEKKYAYCTAYSTT